MTTELISVNYHITRACDSACPFCFGTFRQARTALRPEASARLMRLLRAEGTEKITFAGGEPTLVPHLGMLIELARSLGMTTGVITNGFRLAELLAEVGHALDWVGLSVDSGVEQTQKAMGRGRGDHVARCIQLAAAARSAGCRVKLNTVVTTLNWTEDLGPLVRAIRPERWKVFQVLPVEGQNDGDVEPLLISPEQFEAFLDRHRLLAAEGFPAVAESNDAMLESYAMIDPEGCFYGNAGGVDRRGAPILEVGVRQSLAAVGFEPAKLERRGGIWSW